MVSLNQSSLPSGDSTHLDEECKIHLGKAKDSLQPTGSAYPLEEGTVNDYPSQRWFTDVNLQPFSK